MSRINIKGLDELNANLSRLAKVAPQETEKEVADIALDFASKASNAAPVKYGDLRGSLAVPRKIYKGWIVGSNLPYTRAQHEHLEYKHPLGGGPKFLEYPWNANVDRYSRRIKEVLKNAIK